MSRIKTKFITDNAVTDAKLRQSLATSVIGRSANTTGNAADISASADGQVLQRSASALSWALLVNANIDSAAAIAFSKFAALTSGNILVGSVGNVATSVAMSGEASIVASGAITLLNSAVIGKVLTGYVSGAGTVAATDTILQAIQKLNGNQQATPSFYRAGQQSALQTYTFTVTSANATVGATYTNNSQTFTVITTIAAQTTLVCSGTGAPQASGTLTKATGTGDATITFSTSTNALPTSQVINFSSTLGGTSYALNIAWKNTTDASPQFQPFQITQKFATGCVITWNAPVDTLNYALEYSAFPNV